MGHKKASLAGKGSYALYRVSNTFAKNKKRKLERHLKNFPNDKVAETCLSNGTKFGFSWKRKTPKTTVWSHTDKHHAEVWASLGHSGTKYLEYIKRRSTKVETPSKKVEKKEEVNV